VRHGHSRAIGPLAAGEVIAHCKALVAIGVQHAIFTLPNVHELKPLELKPLELFGREITPAVAGV
jgi:hypothetical protein